MKREGGERNGGGMEEKGWKRENESRIRMKRSSIFRRIVISKSQ